MTSTAENDPVEHLTGTPPVQRPHGSAVFEGTHEDPPLVVRAREAARVLRLVEAGYTYREIGTMLGLSTSTAWRRHRWAVDVLHSCDDVPLPSMRGVRPPARPPVFLDWPDREYYRLRPRPAVRCRAHCRSGARCRAFAVRGAAVCRLHGGAAPQVRRAARTRHARAKARTMVVDLEERGWDPLAPRKRADGSSGDG